MNDGECPVFSQDISEWKMPVESSGVEAGADNDGRDMVEQLSSKECAKITWEERRKRVNQAKGGVR